MTRLPATDRDVIMVFQSYALFPHMTVLENVAYGLHFSGCAKARGAASRAGAAGAGRPRRLRRTRCPAELSGGQQQRVAVARALVLEPQVLLFDEPLSNLDAKLRRRVREEIRELQQSLGLTAVYVTHDQEEALAVSDRIIVMDRAAIAQEGTPRELYEEPATASSPTSSASPNVLPCRIASVSGEAAEVHLGPVVLTLPRRGLKPRRGPHFQSARTASRSSVTDGRTPCPGRC